MVDTLVPAEQPSGAVRILRNAGSILLGDLGGDILTTYAIALAAVKLGPAGFGMLAEAQAFMDPFETAAGFGLVQVTITVAAKRGGCDGTLRGTITGIRMAFAAVAIVVANVAAILTGRANLLPLVLVLSVGSLFNPLATSSNLPFQFGQAMHRVVALPFLTSVVRIATAYLALYFLNTPLGYQLSATLSGLASMLLIWSFARRYYPAKLRFDRTLARELVALAWPAALLEIVVVLYSRAAYFLLHRAGPLVQGEYAAAEKLLRPIFGISAALLVSALPSLAVLAAERDFRRISRLYTTSLVRVALFALPILGAAWVLTPWLLEKFVPEYSGAVDPFRWLAGGAFFMLLNQLSTTFVVAMGRFRAIMTVALVNLGVYFALASFLIPTRGATGAAMATATMEAINTLFQLVMVHWLLRSSARRSQAG
jgi:O-antigen/teichoic acid export membrane protein